MGLKQQNKAKAGAKRICNVKPALTLFYYFSLNAAGMKEETEIEKLQQQMRELHRQLTLQQQTLMEMAKQLAHLKGTSHKPETAQKGVAKNRSFEDFLGLNVMHITGIVVLVIGLSIGVKYAIDKELISAVARMALAYAAGFGLYFFSVRLKEKYSGFSAILFSGALASLYFTSYAAYVYYGFFSFALVFVLMILLTLFTAFTALRYNRQEIAMLGLVGAYAIPFLISKNSGRADLFFLYITIINAAVVYLAYKKAWRPVAYIAQAITWFLFFGWAISNAAAQQVWVGTAAMVVFFVLFQANALFKNKLATPLTKSELYEVFLTNAAVYFGALIVYSRSFSAQEIALISLMFSLFFGAQAMLFYYVYPAEKTAQKGLGTASVLLFVIFIANQWDGIAVTFLWLTLAVLLFAAGVWLKGSWLRLCAIGLMAITLLKLATLDSARFSTIQKILAYLTLGVLLLFISFFYQKFKRPLPPGN